ncbi:hypothetical protein DFH07DRAFT_972406 [Mycena maculata]|uniref:Uncharacterized protein n=1 Tax=Mycena maculata TaxID=230809 RepID=A0AAD7HJ87_9AGAR|nr:hypothetical protein DFH07DRAFT_972406 [Mycena maculata]
MDFDLRDADGLRPEYLWSIRGHVRYCSVGDSPDRIPLAINDYIPLPRPYPKTTISRGILSTVNFEIHAPIYYPPEHWLGWNPINSLAPRSSPHGALEDPAALAFTQDEVELDEVFEEVPGAGGSDGGTDNCLVGYTIVEWWRLNSIYLSRRLRDISVSLVMKSDVYGPNAWTTRLGDMPEPLEERPLSDCHYQRAEAQRAAGDARRNILSQMGFLSWYIAIKSNWDRDLDLDDINFLKSLRLDERKKRGYIFDLSRDYHEANLGFLIKSNVPFHYLWTDAEEANRRFIRWSPQYQAEYSVVAAHAPNGPANLKDMPSYYLWKETLERYDVFFQDQRSGRVGEVVQSYSPLWKYHIIDFANYGARPVENRHVLRAYAARFKAKVQQTVSLGTICTFYRQNPRKLDEPLTARVFPVPHEHPVTAFGRVHVEDFELLAFFEDTYQVREQVKNRYAPRGIERTFNTYNGMRNDRPTSLKDSTAGSSKNSSEASVHLEISGSPLPLEARLQQQDLRRAKAPMSPTRRSETTEDVGITSRWVRDMAETSRRRSSRSLSPRDRGSSLKGKGRHGSRSLSSEGRRPHSSVGSFEDEFLDASEGRKEDGEIEELPEDPAQTGDVTMSQEDPGPTLHSREEAVEAIRRWAPVLTGFEELIPAPNLWYWNDIWLNRSVLVISEPRSELRMKVWAACLGYDDFVQVLNMAIRCGVSFSLYVHQGEVGALGLSQKMTETTKEMLRAMYAPGFVELTLSYGTGGVTLYARYRSMIDALLKRPHATAFIFAGGYLSWLAQLYDENLVERLREGPSLQVTEFLRGDNIRMEIKGVNAIYTTDLVSDGEIKALLGHISTGTEATDTFLWPPIGLLEEEGYHGQGAWSPRFLKFLRNLKKQNIDTKRLQWRTSREWRSYIRKGNKGVYAAEPGCSDDDLAKGQALMKRAFPMDWNKKMIADIQLPEKFVQLAA